MNVTPVRVGALAAAVALVASPIAVAVPQVMPDRLTQFVTDDGWVIDVNTTNEVIDHIDNIAGASNLNRPGSGGGIDVPRVVRSRFV